MHDGYHVSIGKASGEAPWDSISTTEHTVTFILSYSSYHLEISAFNNVSSSPALRRTIRRREEQLGERSSVLRSLPCECARLKPPV